LRAAVRSVRPLLVLIDPVLAFLDAGLGGNDEVQARSVMSLLTGLAEEFNCAVMPLRHWNKAQNLSPLYRDLGATAWTAAARAHLQVTRDGDRCVLAASKFNLGPPPLPVTYRVVGSPGGGATVQWIEQVLDRSAPSGRSRSAGGSSATPDTA